MLGYQLIEIDPLKHANTIKRSTLGYLWALLHTPVSGKHKPPSYLSSGQAHFARGRSEPFEYKDIKAAETDATLDEQTIRFLTLTFGTI